MTWCISNSSYIVIHLVSISGQDDTCINKTLSFKNVVGYVTSTLFSLDVAYIGYVAVFAGGDANDCDDDISIVFLYLYASWNHLYWTNWILVKLVIVLWHKGGYKTRSHQLNMFISEDVCTFYDSNDVIQFRMCSSKAGTSIFTFFPTLIIFLSKFKNKEEILYDIGI